MSNRKCQFSPKNQRRHVILGESSAVTRWQQPDDLFGIDRIDVKPARQTAARLM
jgi:hypothetical protein